jgi:D-2-hydroxyacid dehydrogenase (NADP+)
LRQEFPDVALFETRNEAEVLAVCADGEILISTSHMLADRLIAAMPKLNYILSLTTGLDHLWTPRSLSPSVRITNARGIRGPQMAELAFMYVLGLTRNVRKFIRNQDQQAWDR